MWSFLHTDKGYPVTACQMGTPTEQDVSRTAELPACRHGTACRSMPNGSCVSVLCLQTRATYSGHDAPEGRVRKMLQPGFIDQPDQPSL